MMGGLQVEPDDEGVSMWGSDEDLQVELKAGSPDRAQVMRVPAWYSG